MTAPHRPLASPRRRARAVRWTLTQAALLAAAGAGALVAWQRSEAGREQAARTAADLERSNRDLEQFASLASHDLREPLRTVEGFLGLLQRRHGDSLDAEAQEFVAHALAGTERMQRLVDDLLTYARAGSAELRRVPVDLDALVRATLADLDQQVQATAATIDIGTLPVVEGDARQLGQVVQNLLTNAMKFVAATAPVVSVGAEADDAGWVVSVVDNGIGVDPALAAQAFDMFRRLPGGEGHEGTGVGLAICRRVIERHRGRIWVEPAPGGGSAFRFSLPAQP